MTLETIRRDIDGVDTVIKVIGHGPAVLSLHGAATIEGHEWARGLADRFRVYLPFHPGFGESGPAPHVCGMQDMVVHYLRLIAALDLDRPHLVGHSMGGWMAAEMAAVAGERFNRLVLNAPAGLNHPDYPSTDVSKLAPQDVPLYLAHRSEIAARYFPGGSLAPPAEQFIAARAKEGEALGNIRKAHGMGHPNLRRWLSRIPNETLIIWGDKDRIALVGQAELWAKEMAHARIHIVRDVGHFAMQEDPTCVTAIGDFLAG
ncbi:alpha/beta fold hydrolase [Bradyrhizobium sp. Ec3.3]|uniref:alpha/beta fold hydrolase n=1 Tax=Bradyrhizobium sp. Ec3.3 TaxID=189753 RepID=UPI0012EC19B9|nr:alpha/beta fold hydrolase [Bradyrhizobium sp. Ec3.3]